MRICLTACRARLRERAWALLCVMSLSAAGLMVLAGVMAWSDQNATRSARNNEYFATTYAAESATEKVFSSISEKFQDSDLSTVNGSLSTLATTLLPDPTTDGAYWKDYQYSAGGVPGSIIITNTFNTNNSSLGGAYAGLTMDSYVYEIIATAKNTNSQYQIPVTVGQKITLGYIPLFQFAIFYNDFLEIEPNAPMTVTGNVHGNSDIYAAPKNGLNFNSPVSATGQITSLGDIDFGSFELTGVDPLNLPIGTGASGNVAQDVDAILQIPTSAQTPNSIAGKNLLYNEADLIVLVNNDNSITVTSGAGVDNRSTVINSNDWSKFISTNGSFYDARDQLTVNPVVLDVSNLVAWSATNTALRGVLGNKRYSGAADVQSIYVADLRNVTNYMVSSNSSTATNFTTNGYWTTTPSLPPAYGVVNGINYYGYAPPAQVTRFTNILTHVISIISYTYHAVNEVVTTNWAYITNMSVTSQPGIVLSNGAVLPPQGLAVATPDPAYIVGDWNVKASTNAGAPTSYGSDTSHTLPSAIYSDAMTVLSSAWSPTNSWSSLSSRQAVSTTINSAILTGNVATTNGVYSGGVENLMRYLESWSGVTNTYNGSLVCMFNSQIAKKPYQQAGNYFNPPTRNWAFDNNFLDPNKQPPLTPKAVNISRSQWVLLAPNSTSF